MHCLAPAVDYWAFITSRGNRYDGSNRPYSWRLVILSGCPCDPLIVQNSVEANMCRLGVAGNQKSDQPNSASHEAGRSDPLL